jgi:SAM-dependent MidA family methyltransferase
MTAERLDAFMARANAAYYARESSPFSEFTTAPEVTQVFGELLGAWAAVVWRAMGAPVPVMLVELGPGRGTLMADALRAVGAVAADFAAALRLHLVEFSPTLRAAQAQILPGATWHADLSSVPPGPTLAIANEFFDALPIRQFVRRGAGWAERFVSAGRFVERETAGPGRDAADGEVVEIGEAGRAVMRTLAVRIAAQGGAALVIDYGPADSAPGDSFQALRDGRPADPLTDPGTADLTAHVDFRAIAAAAREAGAATHGPVPQGKFLAELGLFQRTGALARTQPPARASALLEAARRLAEPDAMGRLFKALCVCHPALPSPPGFPA